MRNRSENESCIKKNHAFYSNLPVREWDSSVAASSISVVTSSNSSI